jgi:energy-coupling factor transporter ATP-binding protein EcfA2
MGDPLLEIRNLHARVGDKPILKGVDLVVNAGEVHAVMGPNGSGKSTLANVLAGRDGYEVTDGEVRFEPAGSGTRLVLTHGGWERLDRMAGVARRGYRFGWGYVLAVWAGQKAALSARAVHVVGIVISALAGLGGRRR